MADGISTPSAEQMASLLRAAQGQGGSGTSPLGFRLECNVGSGMTIQNGGLKADATFRATGGARPGMLAKLLKDMGMNGADIFEGMKKVGQAGAVQQCSITDITGQSHGLGRSLGGGDIEIS